MKKRAILLLVFSINLVCFGQLTDTAYTFLPVLIKNLKEVKNLNIIHFKKYVIIFQTDSNNSKLLHTTIKKRERLVIKGDFLLDTIESKYSLGMDTYSGKVNEYLSAVKFRYFKIGTWFISKGRKQKHITYSKGYKN